ncbi:MAG: hypothetical protein QOG30_1268, partial [Acidimicrobiaceae bacterium]
MIGFEAMERDVAQRLVDAGDMPNLARLQREGVTASMTNPIGMLTTPVWPTIVTGVHPDRNGYVSYRVLRRGTYRHEFLGVHPQLTPPPFWRRLADQGLSCLVLDVPTVALDEHPRITHVSDWLTHERTSALSSAPPHIARALQDRFGPAEVDRCDERKRRGELEELRTRVFADIESFETALPWLVQQSDFDVVIAATGSAHCAGHQFWHVHDERSVHFDRAARNTLGDVVSDVYRALDVALGRALELATPDTAVAVVLSHGMGDNTMSPHLIDPVARAIDDAMGRASAWHRTREFLRRAPNRAARRLTARFRRAPFEATYLADGSRRFLPVENFPCFGALRL